MEADDIDIALHKIQMVDSATAQVAINATPGVYHFFAEHEVDCSSLAVVLSLRALPLDALQELRAWQIQEESMLSLPTGDGHAQLAASLAYGEVLQHSKRQQHKHIMTSYNFVLS